MADYLDPLPRKISYEEWAAAFDALPGDILEKLRSREGTKEAAYMRNPECFVAEEGDLRLRNLMFDNSLASFRLWSFLLSEEERLKRTRGAGKKLIGMMKDLGTAPVIAYSSPDAVAFYPDGSWWIPCLMEMSEGLLREADGLGFGEEVCPARAALAAFFNEEHFPLPDLLVGATGSCCDDFSAVMQRVADLEIDMVWWELPCRRDGDGAGGDKPVEEAAGGSLKVPRRVVDFVEKELERVRGAVEKTVGGKITDEMVAEGIRKANVVRGLLARIRDLAYGRTPCPFPALETQICEMLAIHFCSDLEESINVLGHVADTVEMRAMEGEGVLARDACRAVWVNPVADLRVMNVFEDMGGVVAGTEYLFRHALTPISEGVRPLRALALAALSDPMIGPARYRAQLVVEEARKYGAEGVVISNIPGASHCATEPVVIREEVERQLGLPVLEVLVHPLSDAGFAQLRTRFEAFFETIRARRRP